MLAIRKLILSAIVGLVCVVITRQMLQLRHHPAVHSRLMATAVALLGKEWLANESLTESETQDSASAQEKIAGRIAAFETRNSEHSFDELSSTAISASEPPKEQPLQPKDVTSEKNTCYRKRLCFPWRLQAATFVSSSRSKLRARANHQV